MLKSDLEMGIAEGHTYREIYERYKENPNKSYPSYPSHSSST
jgi:hypothetical protein